MTYEQALTLLRQRYGATPWTQASGSEVQSYLRSQGVPSAYITQIGTAYYTAQRTNSSIDNVLQTKGLYTPTATTTTPSTATTAPSLAAPSFTTPAPTTTATTAAPVVTSSAVPTLVTPSFLASQESGAIGAASIASQIKNLPTVTPTLPVTTATSTAAPATTTAPTTTTLSPTQTSGAPLSTYTSAQLQAIITKLQSNGVDSLTDSERIAIGMAPKTPVVAPVTVSPTTISPTTVPTFQNPLATTTPAVQGLTVEGGGTLPNPLATTTPTATTPVTPTMGGSLEDQINYQSAIRRLTAQLQRTKESAGQQAGETRAQYESQIRKAGRDLYSAQVKSLASLAARGISGAPGLSVAAQRAGAAEPEYRRQTLIGERERQLSALNRTLTTQLGDYEEELRKNQEQLTRATTLANQLTGTGQ